MERCACRPVLYFPMLVFSGAALSIEVMPEMMQNIIRVFPMNQGIQLMEGASPVNHTRGLFVFHDASTIIPML